MALDGAHAGGGHSDVPSSTQRTQREGEPQRKAFPSVVLGELRVLCVKSGPWEHPPRPACLGLQAGPRKAEAFVSNSIPCPDCRHALLRFVRAVHVQAQRLPGQTGFDMPINKQVVPPFATAMRASVKLHATLVAGRSTVSRKQTPLPIRSIDDRLISCRIAGVLFVIDALHHQQGLIWIENNVFGNGPLSTGRRFPGFPIHRPPTRTGPPRSIQEDPDARIRARRPIVHRRIRVPSVDDVRAHVVPRHRVAAANNLLVASIDLVIRAFERVETILHSVGENRGGSSLFPSSRTSQIRMQIVVP